MKTDTMEARVEAMEARVEALDADYHTNHTKMVSMMADLQTRVGKLEDCSSKKTC